MQFKTYFSLKVKSTNRRRSVARISKQGKVIYQTVERVFVLFNHISEHQEVFYYQRWEGAFHLILKDWKESVFHLISTNTEKWYIKRLMTWSIKYKKGFSSRTQKLISYNISSNTSWSVFYDILKLIIINNSWQKNIGNPTTMTDLSTNFQDLRGSHLTFAIVVSQILHKILLRLNQKNKKRKLILLINIMTNLRRKL